ncbi:glycosyltransferase [Chondromyces apiculatus]|uniref:Putative teichuronic acid biosynthesis glycosyl transferase TuaC n=1 Tax=Chondromyces apiculatus DSM 436 TaxID=1192034 RepID=A0A017SXB7_9BACT|nr:glycosyltransferase [Chondromyces apiculatus]EYF01573.1 Putative teichuronic acid biosynthesis glycosyl transferase TuaC [Chondromyces apiculatus DSM 436]
MVTTSFPRTSDDPSGHFVRAAALALADAGDEIHVIAPGGSPWDPPVPDGPLHVHHAGGGALFGWPGAVARARQNPLRLLAAATFAAGVRHRLSALGPVDRAIAHWIVPSAYPLLLDPRALSTAGSLHVHAHGADVRLLLRAPAFFRATVLRTLLDRGAQLSFAASALRDDLARALDPALAAALRGASRVELPALHLPALSDVAARAAALRASLDLAPDERLAVTAARLVPSKRVDLAIRAVCATPAAAPPVRLVLVGDGPERAALQRLAPPRVHFLGTLPRPEALAWIAAADVLLHPSALEAAPTVVREARAYGVPVIACAAGDIAAWAQDDPQIQLAEPDAAALTRALTAFARR